ncbi:MAG: Flp pilus assembly complex ATPase component TadA [Planctomycetes bacterium]|nr:Flp pilus assembly complex ATPase component TadA [Planctomycetota bacterium]
MTDHTTAWERFDDWIKKVIELRGTDLHLVPGYKPMARVDGELQPIDDFVLNAEQTHWVGISLFGNSVMHDLGYQGHMQKTRTYGDTVADITLATAGGEKTVVVRLHGGKIPTLEEVGLSERVTELLSPTAGILLVAGPHSSGKTTTLYALVDWINRNSNVKICTVERPRWHLFQPAKALVQQHEVGLDGQTAAAVITSALRQAPNVLMLGEIEDFESLGAALGAAETGHLVIVQVHAVDAADAIQRIIEAAPESMHAQVKRQLAETLRGVTVQRLARHKDGRRRTAVYDIIGEGARKFIDGGKPDAGFYISRAQDGIKQLEDAGSISKEEAERLRREVGA